MRKPDRTLPVHDGRSFAWSGKQGSAEASSLCPATSQMPQHVQPWDVVWDDAADVGFIVRSHRTQREEPFTLVEELRDGEGEVTGWRFAACCDPEVTVTIFND